MSTEATNIDQLNNIKVLLSKVPYFKEVPYEEIEKIAVLLKAKEVSKDEVIISQDDIGRSMFLIDKGEVKVIYRQDDGEEIEKAVLKEGNFFGEMALIHHEPRAASCIAVTTCKLFELDKQALESIINDCPTLHSALKLVARMRKFELLHPYYYKKLFEQKQSYKQ